ncbi:MAG: 1,4-dihydroxy-2-naphthoate octaprenyltransferase [Anaerolineae bacterium]|jgi:1,4-dihydroxy-2-naphthoate octaprenyltransferase|nr:1,4-dihydroxy-2-naphthoate octaprenyltransferase [Anaerolineae bacterium]
MTASPAPGKLAAWYAATRPRVFVASFVPMGLAALLALQDGVFNLPVFLLSLVGVMLLQTAANLVNEYMDFRKGAEDLKQAGQGMVIKQRLLTPAEVLAGAIASVVAGSLIGLFLLAQSGPWLWIIGVGGVLVAITYTAGPYPLAYHGLGEIAAGLFMGPAIVLGAYYVMQPDISAEKGAMLSLTAFPVMLMTAAILHANNIRDLEADRAVHKRTLAVIFGRDVARLEYRVLVIGTYVAQAVLVLIGWLPVTTLLTLITLPQALRLIGIIDRETDPLLLHRAQGGTAQLHGRIGLLLGAGWAAWLLLHALF